MTEYLRDSWNSFQDTLYMAPLFGDHYDKPDSIKDKVGRVAHDTREFINQRTHNINKDINHVVDEAKHKTKQLSKDVVNSTIHTRDVIKTGLQSWLEATTISASITRGLAVIAMIHFIMGAVPHIFFKKYQHSQRITGISYLAVCILSFLSVPNHNWHPIQITMTMIYAVYGIFLLVSTNKVSPIRKPVDLFVDGSSVARGSNGVQNAQRNTEQYNPFTILRKMLYWSKESLYTWFCLIPLIICNNIEIITQHISPSSSQQRWLHWPNFVYKIMGWRHDLKDQLPNTLIKSNYTTMEFVGIGIALCGLFMMCGLEIMSWMQANSKLGSSSSSANKISAGDIRSSPRLRTVKTKRTGKLHAAVADDDNIDAVADSQQNNISSKPTASWVYYGQCLLWLGTCIASWDIQPSVRAKLFSLLIPVAAFCFTTLRTMIDKMDNNKQKNSSGIIETAKNGLKLLGPYVF